MTSLQPPARVPFGLFIHQNKWTAGPHIRLHHHSIPLLSGPSCSDSAGPPLQSAHMRNRQGQRLRSGQTQTADSWSANVHQQIQCSFYSLLARQLPPEKQNGSDYKKEETTADRYIPSGNVMRLLPEAVCSKASDQQHTDNSNLTSSCLPREEGENKG